MSTDFLEREVESWKTDDGYKSSKTTVTCTRVVNDIADCGVALMYECNKLHTNIEQQKQYLLLVVKEFHYRYQKRNRIIILKFKGFTLDLKPLNSLHT